MITDDGLSSVVAAAHHAASDPSRFDDMLVLLTDVCGAHGGALFTPVLDPDGKNLAASSGCCREALVEYARGWAAHDAWLREIRATTRYTVPGDVLVGQQYLAPDQLHRTPFHADFLRRHDIESVVSLLVCDGSGRLAPETRVSLFRPPGVRPFDNAEMAAVRYLWPHLQRSVETYWLLRKAREFDRVAEAALDALPHPLWVLRKDATFDHANAAALNLMAAHDGWVRCVGRSIVVVGQFGADDLRGAMARGTSTTLVCTRATEDRLSRAVLRLMPIGAESPFARAWPAARALLTVELPADEGMDAAWYERVAKHYRLTPAEQRVMLRLAEGQPPKQIAEELRVSVATVRTHVQTLLFKTACRRQIDLLRLVLGH